MGSCEVNNNYDQSAKVSLIIVQGSGPTLLGRNWLTEICLNWQEIHYLHLHSGWFVTAQVSQNSLGKLAGFKAKIHVQPMLNPSLAKVCHHQNSCWEGGWTY